VARAQAEFGGTARYRIKRRLGEGSVGVVYLARDEETGRDVALKTLRRVDPLGLFRFKQEFRALADVRHTNLASLFELTVDRGTWFFTMELVFGVDFLSYVNAGASKGDLDSVAKTLRATQMLTIDLDAAPVSRERPAPERKPDRPSPDHGRIRECLRQLGLGIMALHGAGKLHRDIKPSNVLVTPEDRLVLLDFGLVTELSPGGFELGGRRRVCGTAGYMSPEQGAAEPISSASDWYSVGVMLYEALTGDLPFLGSVEQVLDDKRRFEATPASAVATGVPGDLDRLACDLLRIDPRGRPSGREVLERLGARAPDDLPRSRPPTAPTAPIVAAGLGPFIGRSRQIAQLEHAFAASTAGHTVVVSVSGPSGIGKTVAAKRFLDDLERSGRATVLAGRCYERESVPYKALDPIMDALCHRLMLMEAEALEEVLPSDAVLIARLFPVLRRVEPIGRERDREIIVDPRELSRRAVLALRALLAGLARERPVVLFIDDLQWGDADSAQLLSLLLEPPAPPPLLLLTAHRSEDDDTPIVESLRSIDAEIRELEIGPLDPTDALELARALLDDPPRTATAEENARSIAEESAGSPFFISELARYTQGRPKRRQLELDRITLEDVLEHRIDRLPPIARRLLDVVAVSGRPLRQSVAFMAAGLLAEDRGAIDLLRHQHFVRTRGARGDDLVETYHDRMRHAAVTLLDAPELEQIHLAIAGGLSALDPSDAEGLAAHYEGGGRRDDAAAFATIAAEQAFAALAFDRAADLFRKAIDLAPDHRAVTDHYARLGDALANAGRGADAANAYLEGARGVAPQLAVERRRRAAEQFLRSGYVDEGLAALEEVAAACGLSLPRTPKRALASLLVRRARLGVRGTAYVERPESRIDPEILARIDVSWSGALGLGMIDVIRSVDLHAGHFLLALDAGEPYRVARAFVGEALTVATAGGPGREKARRLVHEAEEIAARIDHPHALGLAAMAAGMAENLVGHWKNARRHYARAEQLFVERCTGAAWETSTVRHMSFWALAYLGGMKELSARVPIELREARRRGDLYAAAQLATGLPNLAWVARDDVEAARRVIAEGMGRWSQHGFHLQHYNDLLAQVQLDLYESHGETAVRRLATKWRALERSLLLRVQQVRIEALHLYARARLLWAATATDQRASALAFVGKVARSIEKERMPWGFPLATLLEAGSKALSSELEAAAQLYGRAAREADDADMPLFGAAAMMRRGELVGGSEGQALVDAGAARMLSEGVRDPARFAAMLVPHRSASSR
jgi:serine/threonine protein kinase/tetratricopeptide (TPR) repeat protein